MTNEEAKKNLVAYMYFAMDELPKQVGEAISVACNALEKQIPKKIADDEAFGQCPVCGYVFNSELVNEYDIKYCPFCGQALDFSERSDTDEN